MTVNKRGLLTGFKWFSLWLTASVALTALVIEVVDPRYLFNDDMVIAAVASGDYTGTPDPHTIYSGALFSFLLVAFSLLAKQIPWFLLTLTFCSTSLLLLVVWYFYRVVRMGYKSAIVVFLPVLASQLLLAFWALSLPHYTVASIAGTSVALLIIFAFTQNVINPPWWVVIATSTFFFALGWTVRSGGFSASIVLIVAMPSIIVLVRRLSLARALTISGFWLAVVMIEATSFEILYSSGAWKEALSIIDRLNIIWSGYVLASVVPIGLAQGWTGGEIALVQSLSPVPSGSFTGTSLARFLEAAQLTLVGDWAIEPIGLDALVQAVSRSQGSLIVVGLITLAASAWLLWTRTTRVVPWILVGGNLVWTLSIVLFLGLIRTHPAHVTFPLAVSSGLFLTAGLLFLGIRHVVGGTLQPLWFALFLTVPVFVYSISNAYSSVVSTLRTLEQKKVSWEQIIPSLRTLGPGCIALGVNLGTENAPARRAPGPFFDYPIVQLGWPSLAPTSSERLQALAGRSWNDLFDDGSCLYFVGEGTLGDTVARVSTPRSTPGVFEAIPRVDGGPEVLWRWRPALPMLSTP